MSLLKGQNVRRSRFVIPTPIWFQVQSGLDAQVHQVKPRLLGVIVLLFQAEHRPEKILTHVLLYVHHVHVVFQLRLRPVRQLVKDAFLGPI